MSSTTRLYRNVNRRDFLKTGVAAVGGAGLLALGDSSIAFGYGANEKLNVACIGVGGKGFDDVRNVMSENIVAICDVDTKHAADAFKMFSKAKKYSDYRRMLDKEARNINAVVVATPDHVHIPASIMAMRMGKHVYCEKPLGQNIHEIRVACFKDD
jgi:predicted dehydrogenase